METVQADDVVKLSAAEMSGRNEEILAICKLHGMKGRNTVEMLKALDVEFHHLKEQGQSAKADHVQTLYDWKSKQSAADSKHKSTQPDEQQFLDWAFLKYMDAVSLQPQMWQYNFHAGRMLLSQKKNNEALKLLQTALAQKPTEPCIRFYTGLVVLDRDDGLGPQTRYAIQYLQQGLEKLLAQLQFPDENPPSHEGPSLRALNPISLLNIQFHKGIFRLGTFLFNPPAGLPEKTMTPEQVLTFSADLAAWALSKYPYRGTLVHDLEWLLLEAHFTLLDLTCKKPNVNDEFISRRCQNLALILKHTNIPICHELLEMQETVCQLRVEKTPCDSNALYMLGLAQIVDFDNETTPAKAKILIEEACLSFRASISLENKPMSGEPPMELIQQKWWQDWKLDESQKAMQQKQQKVEAKQELKLDQPDTKAAPFASGSRPSSKSVISRVKIPSIRGSAGASKTSLSGRSKASEPSKPTRGRAAAKTSPAPSTTAKASDQTAATSSNQPQTSRAPESDTPGINHVSFAYRLGLARALTRIDEKSVEAQNYYKEVIKMAPAVHDAYIEFANLLLKTDPLQAVDIYAKFPVKPIEEQTYNDAFITGEIVRLLMKSEKYDDARLGPNMIAYGKVMGLASIDGYINTLDHKLKTQLLMKTYAGIHGKPLNDPELQAFFTFKHWI
ncbi:uncharacterized protein LOC116976443 [Amblyraja radiata]|uniref:uncharacterized protein LOC116976443 n=1 Tax=Amblyraja radiata TaxID=386614 RepID=UPI0014039904|nr:uncharacterized protein LOC116976443 [Amblyraja radiata]